MNKIVIKTSKDLNKIANQICKIDEHAADELFNEADYCVDDYTELWDKNIFEQSLALINKSIKLKKPIYAVDGPDSWHGIGYYVGELKDVKKILTDNYNKSKKAAEDWLKEEKSDALKRATKKLKEAQKEINKLTKGKKK